jgi:hypothetical protein
MSDTGSAAYVAAQTSLARPLSIPVGRVLGHSYVEGTGAQNHFNGYALRVLRALGVQKQVYAGYAGSVS